VNDHADEHAEFLVPGPTSLLPEQKLEEAAENGALKPEECGTCFDVQLSPINADV
jgi:hypothetical protein